MRGFINFKNWIKNLKNWYWNITSGYSDEKKLRVGTSGNDEKSVFYKK